MFCARAGGPRRCSRCSATAAKDGSRYFSPDALPVTGMWARQVSRVWRSRCSPGICSRCCRIPRRQGCGYGGGDPACGRSLVGAFGPRFVDCNRGDISAVLARGFGRGRICAHLLCVDVSGGRDGGFTGGDVRAAHMATQRKRPPFARRAGRQDRGQAGELRVGRRQSCGMSIADSSQRGRTLKPWSAGTFGPLSKPGCNFIFEAVARASAVGRSVSEG